MGFFEERCYNNPCPAVDEEECVKNGGSIITTENGCCKKCQAADCFECSRITSTLPKYLVVGKECISSVPIAMSYCDGFCRGSYYWSLNGPIRQWSCCKPSTKIASPVLLKCHNGSELVYQYEAIMSCECTFNCLHRIMQDLESPSDLFTTRST